MQSDAIYFQNEKENKKDGSDEINKEIIELEREEERMKIKLEKMDISKKGIVGGITSNTGQDSVFRNFNKNRFLRSPCREDLQGPDFLNP